MIYLGKNLALKDWMIFAELFGMPVRIAKYDPTATAEEKRELQEMLKSLGSQAAGIFSRAVDLQVIEANRGTIGPPYEKLIDFLNREMSKAWLGQTLTTDVAGVSGTLTASKVHEEVRKDLRADDLRKEAYTIRRDLLTPLVRLQFGPHAPVPHFRRKLARPSDATEFTQMLGAAVNRLGLRIPLAWAHETLGIPLPAEGEPVIQRVQGSGRRAGAFRTANVSER
jgi:phage gp29-like protein